MQPGSFVAFPRAPAINTIITAGAIVHIDSMHLGLWGAVHGKEEENGGDGGG